MRVPTICPRSLVHFCIAINCEEDGQYFFDIQFEVGYWCKRCMKEKSSLQCCSTTRFWKKKKLLHSGLNWFSVYPVIEYPLHNLKLFGYSYWEKNGILEKKMSQNLFELGQILMHVIWLYRLSMCVWIFLL